MAIERNIAPISHLDATTCATVPPTTISPAPTGAPSTKTKELIAFAIVITVRCDGCLAHRSQAVLKVGATREEVAEMIGVTLLMGGGPSSV